MNGAKADKDLTVEKKIRMDGLEFFNINTQPFEIRGVFYENGKYRRLPESLGESLNEGLKYNYTNTSGGRVRFKTDSSVIAISVKMNGICKMSHCALTGSTGFDMYYNEGEKYKYFGTFIPPFDVTDEGFESKHDFKTTKLREITINFPLYSGVSEFNIGVCEGSILEKPNVYKCETPIVYYGHSITQGGCASRPGNSFPSIISRRFDIDYINLGFSGGAKGEKEIAEYISELDMSLLVYDYDHNAPNFEYLKETHEKMFKIIRNKHPNLPIIMMTTTAMPRFDIDHKERKEVVYQTYKNAVDNGDENVYFLDGNTIYSICGDDDFSGTVEGNHANDLGFTFIAKVLGDMIEKILF